MTTEQLYDLFEKHHDEFMKFDRIEHPRSRRADLHAFLLLDELCTTYPTRDMIAAGEHDVIYLAPYLDELAVFATEGHIIELIRCGVMVEKLYECLFMFV